MGCLNAFASSKSNVYRPLYPLQVLVENASEGDETALEAALELIVLLKEKSTCAVYFAAKSLDKAVGWTPKVR